MTWSSNDSEAFEGVSARSGSMKDSDILGSIDGIFSAFASCPLAVLKSEAVEIDSQRLFKSIESHYNRSCARNTLHGP